MNFIDSLKNCFSEHSNADYALAMKAYMKHNFDFYGIKTPQRRLLLKNISEDFKNEIKTNFREICLNLYEQPQRELHYCAIDILVKQLKNKFVLKDIDLIYKLLTTHSWWDSVDVVSKYLLGGYLLQFQNEKLSIIERFSNANNMWLNRSAIIFQLGYKKNTDFELLKSECEKHKTSNEFFIQKAIGWALREYATYNPHAVLEYVENTNLKKLSQKEAIRKLI